MKKLTALLLALTMLLSFAACGSTGTEPAADKAAELPELALKPGIIAENNAVTIELVDCDPDDPQGFRLDLKIINKLDKQCDIQIIDFYVNGMKDDTIEGIITTVAAAAELEQSLYIRSAEQLENGVDALTKIEFTYAAYSRFETVVLYPYGEKNYTRYLRPAKEGDLGIYDGPEGSAVYTGFFWDESGRLNLSMYLQNDNQEYDRYFEVENVCVNGTPVEYSGQGFGFPVNPGTADYEIVRIEALDLLAAGIVNIEEVSFDLTIAGESISDSRGHVAVSIEDSSFGSEYFDENRHLNTLGAALIFPDDNSLMETLMDNEYCEVVLDSMFLMKDGTLYSNIYIKNKTDKPLSLLFMVERYNGLYHSMPVMVNIEAGSDRFGGMLFRNDGPEKDYIEVITHIAGSISVIAASGVAAESERFNIYPYGEAFAYNYTRELQPEDRVVLDNDDLCVAVTGYTLLEEDAGYMVQLYVEQKNTIYVDASVEWARVDEMSYDMTETKVGAMLFNAPAGYFTLQLPTGYGITDPENIELDFNIAWDSILADGSTVAMSEQASVKVLP